MFLLPELTKRTTGRALASEQRRSDYRVLVQLRKSSFVK